MDKGNKKKYDQLGMPIGTATARLRKNILFKLVQQLELDICFQCGERITDIDSFSIEHKIPWLNSEKPVELFFDLNNIAFSHLYCNIGNARKGPIKYKEFPHGTDTGYNERRCRCSECTEAHTVRLREYRKRKREMRAGGIVSQ